MTKAEIVKEVSKSTGIENATVSAVVEGFMEAVKGSLAKANNVYLRGFGTFEVKNPAGSETDGTAGRRQIRHIRPQ